MSDSSPDFRASQSAHAQEVRAVHILTKTLGCTRSQAIRAIRLQQAQRAQPVNANAGSKAQNLFQDRPQIKRTEVANPIVRQAEPARAEPLLNPPVLPTAPVPLPDTANCVIVVSGVLYTADVYIDGTSLTIVT